jgi:hypothetical protein
MFFLNKKLANINPVLRAYERWVQLVHRSGARRAKNGAYESLKGPIALVIDLLFLYVLGIFNYF